MARLFRASHGAQRERLLVCLDLQQASLGGGQGPDRCAVNCRRVLAHARENDWAIVHVHAKRACAEEARPIAGLEPSPMEPVVYRPGPSAFSSKVFREMVAGASCELVVVGYASTLATALIAQDENLTVTLVEDAVAATPYAPATREAMALVMRRTAGAFSLTSTNALLGHAPLLRVV